MVDVFIFTADLQKQTFLEVAAMSTIYNLRNVRMIVLLYAYYVVFHFQLWCYNLMFSELVTSLFIQCLSKILGVIQCLLCIHKNFIQSLTVNILKFTQEWMENLWEIQCFCLCVDLSIDCNEAAIHEILICITQWNWICSEMQCSVIRCSEIHWSEMHCSEMQCSMIHCSEMQCSMIHCNKMQCCEMIHFITYHNESFTRRSSKYLI